MTLRAPKYDGEVKIEFDWKAYFRGFNELHGGSPIVHKRMLLYRDGYRYSMYSYEGPEYPPPEDKVEKLKLQITYWNRRHTLIKLQQRKLNQGVDAIIQLQSERSAPLRHVIEIDETDEMGRVIKRTRESSQLDESYLLEGKGLVIKHDLTQCQEELKGLHHALRKEELKRAPQTTKTH